MDLLFTDDPEEMTPEHRLAEVAAILATGYRRLFTEKPLDCPGAPAPVLDEGLTPGEPGPSEVQV